MSIKSFFKKLFGLDDNRPAQAEAIDQRNQQAQQPSGQTTEAYNAQLIQQQAEMLEYYANLKKKNMESKAPPSNLQQRYQEVKQNVSHMNDAVANAREVMQKAQEQAQNARARAKQFLQQRKAKAPSIKAPANDKQMPEEMNFRYKVEEESKQPPKQEKRSELEGMVINYEKAKEPEPEMNFKYVTEPDASPVESQNSNISNDDFYENKYADPVNTTQTTVELEMDENKSSAVNDILDDHDASFDDDDDLGFDDPIEDLPDKYRWKP